MTARAPAPVLALALAASAAACVVQPASQVFMCYSNDDCEAGEICGEDHVCYGNPPAMPLGAVLTPPLDRPELPPSESSIGFSSTGDFELRFEEPALVSGRVVMAADPAMSVAAKIIFRRPSRIPGGPDLVVSTDSRPDKAGDAASFELYLPPTAPGESYEVTIYPDDGQLAPGNGGPTAAELVPPYRQTGVVFDAASDPTPPLEFANVVFPLGNGTGVVKKISGRVTDLLDRGIGGYTVRAFGRFSPLGDLELASSRSTTDGEGYFSIVVPVAWLDDFELRLISASGTGLPDIVRRNVHVDDPQGGVAVDALLPDIVLPAYPPLLDFELSVLGLAPQGGDEPVVGATVRLTTTILDSEDLRIFLRAQAVVDMDGHASLTLVPGLVMQPRDYLLDVIPPPDSPHAQAWALPLAVGGLGGLLPMPITLEPRVLVTGVIADDLGAPAADVRVRVEPAQSFSYDLRETTGAVLTDAQWPEAVSEADGRFQVYLDPGLGGVAARYRLTLEPRPGSLLPLYAIDDVGALPDDTGSLDLGEVRLPDTAFVRGTVRDASGVPVAGASVTLFEIVDLGILCMLAPQDGLCEARAPLRARGVSDEVGFLRFALPRP